MTDSATDNRLEKSYLGYYYYYYYYCYYYYYQYYANKNHVKRVIDNEYKSENKN